MVTNSIKNVEKYDLLAPDIRRNPYPVYARLRAELPVYRLPHTELGAKPWLVTRYGDCMNLLKDERFTKDMQRVPGGGYGDDPMKAAAASINRHMLTVDPPDHTRLRDLVHKAFTPRMIAKVADRVQEIANDLLDKVQERGEMDLIHDFAIPVPITVIAELLGIPAEDRVMFREWTQAIIVEGTRGGNSERIGTAALEFIMYFHEMFDNRRAEPKDDLISGLVQVEEAGDKLSAEELISMVFLLLAAGHETTVNLIGNGTLALLQQPDELARLRADPTLIKSAVEEMLRYEGPIGTSTMRWALDDVEIEGQVIPAGDMVLASLLSADHDPSVFENPDKFDITRTPNKHIAFGNGIHYCLGAPLARLEGAIAITTLFDRMPSLQLAIAPDQIEWTETLLLRGMLSLPVAFGAK